MFDCTSLFKETVAVIERIKAEVKMHPAYDHEAGECPEDCPYCAAEILLGQFARLMPHVQGMVEEFEGYSEEIRKAEDLMDEAKDVTGLY